MFNEKYEVNVESIEDSILSGDVTIIDGRFKTLVIPVLKKNILYVYESNYFRFEERADMDLMYIIDLDRVIGLEVGYSPVFKFSNLKIVSLRDVRDLVTDNPDKILERIRQSKEFEEALNSFDYEDLFSEGLGGSYNTEFDMYYFQEKLSNIELLKYIHDEELILDYCCTLLPLNRIVYNIISNDVINDLKNAEYEKYPLSDEDLRNIKIFNILEQVGKTCNVFTNGEWVKCTTKFIKHWTSDGYCFQTAVGWDDIRFKDVERIKFNRKEYII